MDVLLNYAFQVTLATPAISPTTSFLKKVLCIAKPSDAQPQTIVECSTVSEIEALTDNVDIKELLDAGMSSVYVLPSADLDLADVINESLGDFYTVLVSSDYDTTELAAKDFGNFSGVVGYSFTDQTAAKTFGATKNNAAFYGIASNKAKNMFYAFGKLLSGTAWGSRQYSDMPYDDEVSELGDAKSLFDDRIGFVLTSDTYGKKLAMFTCDTRAIVAPYIIQEITLLLQVAAVNYIATNEPDYTEKEAALLEDSLQKIIDAYIDENKTVESGDISISIPSTADNFEVAGSINIAEPRALWRVESVLTTE